jgi:putative transposase
MADHVHMLVSIPPKHAVSQVVGYLKGRAQSTSRGPTWGGARTTPGSILGPGYFVSTVGGTRLPFASTSSTKNRRTSARIS